MYIIKWMKKKYKKIDEIRDVIGKKNFQTNEILQFLFSLFFAFAPF